MAKKPKVEKLGSEKELDPELRKAIDEILKDEGDESLKLGLNSGIMKCETVSTRCLSLDIALGVGGLPRGRIVEIYGPEASGKTTLALTAVAEAQAAGGVAAFIDAENALDPTYASNIGVDLDNLLFSQPDSGEQALRICDKLINSGKTDIIVVDSVAALVPQKELDGEIGDQQIGAQARLMSQALRKLSGAIRRSRTCLIFINQIREKVGMMMRGASNESTPGGRALKFYASVRLDIRKVGTLKNGDTASGNQVRVKVSKNKVAPPFRIANFDIIFGEGANTAGSLIDVGVAQKLVTKSGSMFTLRDEKVNGRQAACEWLKKNPDFMKELDVQLREMVFSKSIMETSEVKEG